MRNVIDDYKFYKKFDFIPPRLSEIKGIDNISIGSNCSFGMGCTLYAQDGENGTKIDIGNGVSINYNVSINADAGGYICIGNDSLIGPGVIMRASNHCFEKDNILIKNQGHIPGVIIIGSNVWIGAGAILLTNIKIGDNSIVGAGSVVTKDVPKDVVVAGVPAKVINNRNLIIK